MLHPDRKGRSRVFSVSSSPLDQKKVAITFRDTGSGFKRTINDLSIGSPLMVEGPHGFYVLPRNPSRPFVLVAGGVGITPFMSMLRYATQSGYDPGQPITLIYANTSEDRAAYLDEIKATAINLDFLSFKNHFGPVNEDAFRKYVKNYDDIVWMISGPPLMVDAARSALNVLGVGANRVFFESFVGY